MKNYPYPAAWLALLLCAVLPLGAQTGYTTTGPSPCEQPPAAAQFKAGDIIYVRNFSGGFDRMIYAGRNRDTAWGVQEHYIHEPGDPDAILLLPKGTNLAERTMSAADYRARSTDSGSACTKLYTDEYVARFKGNLLRQLNAYRARNGSGPLAYDAALDLAAQRYTDYAAQDYRRTYANQHFADGRSPDDRMLEAAKELGYHIEDFGGFELPYDGKMGENAVLFNRLCAERALAIWQGSPGHDRQMKNNAYRLVGIGVSCGVRANGKPFLFAVTKFAHARWPTTATGTPPTTALPTPAEAPVTTPGEATTSTPNDGELTTRGTGTTVPTTPTTYNPPINPAPAVPTNLDCTEVDNYAVWYAGEMARYNRLPEGYALVSADRAYALVVSRDGELLVARVSDEFDIDGRLYVQTCAAVWRAPLANAAHSTVGSELYVRPDGTVCFSSKLGKSWCHTAGNGVAGTHFVLDNNGTLRTERR